MPPPVESPSEIRAPLGRAETSASDQFGLAAIRPGDTRRRSRWTRPGGGAVAGAGFRGPRAPSATQTPRRFALVRRVFPVIGCRVFFKFGQSLVELGHPLVQVGPVGVPSRRIVGRALPRIGGALAGEGGVLVSRSCPLVRTLGVLLGRPTARFFSSMPPGAHRQQAARVRRPASPVPFGMARRDAVGSWAPCIPTRNRSGGADGPAPRRSTRWRHKASTRRCRSAPCAWHCGNTRSTRWRRSARGGRPKAVRRSASGPIARRSRTRTSGWSTRPNVTSRASRTTSAAVLFFGSVSSSHER